MSSRIDDREFNERKGHAAKVLGETGSIAEAAKKTGIPAWVIRQWWRQKMSFRRVCKSYQKLWNMKQHPWRYRASMWFRNQRAELGYLVIQAFSKLSPVKWRCRKLYWRVRCFFEGKSEVCGLLDVVFWEVCREGT